MNEDSPQPTTTQNNRLAQFARPFVVLSLVLAVALIAIVLVGSKVYFNRVALQPVSMPQLPSPMADSPECASLISSLPTELVNHPRAELTEPVPAGAAAWQKSSTERVTLRCGVEMPLQYTSYTPTEVINGTRWMRLDDPVPGSMLTTWYTTDRRPAVAVTANREERGPRTNPPAELDVTALPEADVEPAPAPLSDLDSPDTSDPNIVSTCDALQDALPDEVAQGYTSVDVSEDHTAAWTSPGAEPIVVRCGVADPENYEAGAQLYQINDIPWFEDTSLSSGTDATTWFALGRVIVVAAYLPQASGNEAATNLTNAIAASVPEQS